MTEHSNFTVKLLVKHVQSHIHKNKLRSFIEKLKLIYVCIKFSPVKYFTVCYICNDVTVML